MSNDLSTGIWHYNASTDTYHQLGPLEAWEYNGTIVRGFHPPLFDRQGKEVSPALFHGKPLKSAPAVDAGVSLKGESGWQDPR